LNRTEAKAVDGKTPYEAVFDKKPDMRGLRIWGERSIWVHLEDTGDKLEGRVKEARQLGLDEQSKGIRVYWPDKQTVIVERNVYYEPTARNEGEEDAPVSIPTVEIRTVSNPYDPSAEKTAKTVVETADPNVNADDGPAFPPAPKVVPEPEPVREARPQRARRLSQRIRDIVAGKAVYFP